VPLTDAVVPAAGLSPTEQRKLSPEQRQAILSAAAALAEGDYRTDSELTDFEAFGEEDRLPVSSTR
jgi:hypothetical protein